MAETVNTPDQSVQRRKLADHKAAELANEAIARGLGPFLCVVVLQTYNGRTVRGICDTRAIPDDDKLALFLAKVSNLVEEFCLSQPNLSPVAGTGPS